MYSFMIGQHRKFDDVKYRRDFKKGFYGIEACLFQTEEDVNKLIRIASEDEFKICIHFPLRSGLSKIRDPLFLSPIESVREHAYQYVGKELEYLSRLKPQYILFHYPKPVILDENVNWDNWRFGDRSEYLYESGISFDDFKKYSEQLFMWLTDKSETYGFTPVLEFDALNSYIYKTNMLEELLVKYSKVKLCLDAERLHLQDTMDQNFDSRGIIKRYAKYAQVIHLSTVQPTNNKHINHYPVLPELNPEEGWAPIEDYLKIIRDENKDLKIMFEHRSELIDDDALERCYSWVSRILNTKI